MNRKRKAIAAALALVLAVALLGVAFAQSKPDAGKVPKAVIENKTVQLGEIIEGQEFAYTFKVKNAGGADLQIISVKPG
ncbi:MAG: hypothetical protein PHD74_03365 [Candidatus Krumholzibacteria bacterium]|nr:hypothetical protein [Candidatus Krumholzibacteria bacterium]